jgi:hypothetical protein
LSDQKNAASPTRPRPSAIGIRIIRPFTARHSASAVHWRRR